MSKDNGFFRLMRIRKLIGHIFRSVWKIWGLTAAYLPVVVLSPLLILLIAFFPYRYFWYIERLWAKWILFAMGFRLKRIPKHPDYDPKRQYIIIANHTSMIDIPVVLAAVNMPVTFVGKAELARYPVFGYVYRKTNVLVNRRSLESRKKVYDETEKFVRAGVNIVIFPEGGVPDDTSLILAPFKAGAFRMAIEHKLPVLPLVLYDDKKRLPYDFFVGGPGKLRVEFLPVIETEKLKPNDWTDLRDYAYTLIYNKLAGQDLADKKLIFQSDLS